MLHKKVSNREFLANTELLYYFIVASSSDKEVKLPTVQEKHKSSLYVPIVFCLNRYYHPGNCPSVMSSISTVDNESITQIKKAQIRSIFVCKWTILTITIESMG